MTRKPLIALIVDWEDWAFAHIAHQVTRYNSEFEFAILALEHLVDDLHAPFVLDRADILHYFNRSYVHNLFSNPDKRRYLESLGVPYATLLQKVASRLSLSVHDQLSLDERAIADYRDVFNRAAGYFVASQRLFAIYSALPGIPAPLMTIQEGVDLSQFYPQNLGRFEHVGRRPFVVGWAGTSSWDENGLNVKGFNTVIRPAIAELRAEGVDVVGHYADRDMTPVAYEEMPGYYASIDAYVCASEVEGTPHPILEAMACGVPIISTDVGIVPEVFGALQSGFILRERSVPALKGSIRQLIDTPSELVSLSKENLVSIQSWDWAHRAPRYGEYFNALLSKSGRSPGS